MITSEANSVLPHEIRASGLENVFHYFCYKHVLYSR